MLFIFWHNWTHSLWTHLSAFSLKERKKWTVSPFHGLKVQTDLTGYWNNEFFSHTEASSYQYSMTINMDTLSLYFFDLTDRGNRVFDDCVLNVIKKYIYMKKAPKSNNKKEKRKENEHKLRAFKPHPPTHPHPRHTAPKDQFHADKNKITVSCWQKQGSNRNIDSNNLEHCKQSCQYQQNIFIQYCLLCS